MSQPDNDQGRLMTMRIIWAALLMGQVIFISVIFYVIWPSANPTNRLSGQARTMLVYAATAMLLTAIPIGYFLRAIAYRNRGIDGKIAWPSYFTGNILLYALSEGVSLAALVFMMLDQQPWPFLAISIVAMANQAINFPTGNT